MPLDFDGRGQWCIDRKFRATVKLGNHNLFDGESIPISKLTYLNQKLYPLIYSDLHGKNDFKGKIVLCENRALEPNISLGRKIKKAGGVGMIVMNNRVEGYTTSADEHLLPASNVS